jgi:iron complex outermembrane receptor protein
MRQSFGRWERGASLVAMAALLAGAPAMAQDDQDEGGSAPNSSVGSADEGADPADGTIVVTGIRQALQTARDRKRDADTVMESISATDIGAFPDKSVAEALQRVPGITVNRFALNTDTAHFTAEPSGVIIRGLGQVRNEFNGRDTFSANSSRGLSWGDVPAELLGGVDVYKNQTADLIEGGIAGSVNLRTRVPFDARGELIQIGVKANYGDAAKKWSPDVNAFYSNRWNTEIGELGLMGHVAYSHVNTASLGLQSYRAGIFTGGMIAGSEDVDGEFGPGGVVIPTGVNFLDAEYERKRTGIAAAAQWKSNDQRLLATAQFIRSNYDNRMREHGVGTGLYGIPSSNPHYRFQPGFGDIPRPAPGTDDFTFGEDGFIDHGVFTIGGGWWGSPTDDANMARNEDGEAMVRSCYGWGAGWAYAPGYCDVHEGQDVYDRHGVSVGTSSRYSKSKNMTQEAGFNLKYEATDNLRFNFDAQWVDSDISLQDDNLSFGSWANVELDDLGTRPRVAAFHAPTNIAQSEGGLGNPNNYYVNVVADNIQDSHGNEWAFRGDGEWNTPFDWADTVRFGLRYADRDQHVQSSTYNWNNVSNTWTNGCQYLYFNLDSQPGTCTSNGVTTTFNGYPTGFYEMTGFGNPFFGGSLGTFPLVPFEFFEDGRLGEFSRERISSPDPVTGAGGIGSYIPLCERAAQPGTWVANEMPDSCFAPDEVARVSETTRAAYLMVKFGGNDDMQIGQARISGNFGLRYINTRVKALGFEQYPRITANPATACPATPLVPGGLTGNATAPVQMPGQPPQVPYSPICYLSPDDVAFASGTGVGIPLNSEAEQNHFLPSFNLKLDFPENWVLRFAASRAMSRPDMGLLRSYLNISQGLPGSSPDDDQWVKDAQGNVVGVTPEYMASAFNPKLKPTTAWQFDVSLEHYFGNAGLFSLAVFHKQFYDYIQYGRFTTDVTFNGVTRTVQVSGPANGKGAKIQGLEVAYTRFFDFLPEPLNGLGMQANYTFVKNKGVPNSNLSPIWPSVFTPPSINPGSLEGLSKHSFNVVGLYEKGPIGARIAYNWRNRYLITASDCCVGLPVWNEAAGYLDASIRYKVTENFELNLEGSNLLNTQTVTLQQMSDSTSPEGRMILMQNSWFRQDRRFSIGIRWRMGS